MFKMTLDETEKKVKDGQKMDNTKSKSAQKSNTNNRSMKDTNNASKAASKKKNKRISQIQNKKAQFITVNADVLRESRKMEQEYYKQKAAETAVSEQEKEVSTEVETALAVEASKAEATGTETTPIKAKEVEDVQNNGANDMSYVPVDEEKISNVAKDTSIPNTPVEVEEKKDKRPSSIELKDKSDTFKKIIDLALAYEKIEEECKKLKSKVKAQSEEIRCLKDERDSVKGNLTAMELLCQKKQTQIDELQAVIEHRNEVIDIVKADKDESSQEFKNALAAAMRIYMQDFRDLKKLEMCDDVGYAVVDTLEGVFKVLEKNGIIV